MYTEHEYKYIQDHICSATGVTQIPMYSTMMLCTYLPQNAIKTNFLFVLPQAPVANVATSRVSLKTIKLYN